MSRVEVQVMAGLQLRVNLESSSLTPEWKGTELCPGTGRCSVWKPAIMLKRGNGLERGWQAAECPFYFYTGTIGLGAILCLTWLCRSKTQAYYFQNSHAGNGKSW